MICSDMLFCARKQIEDMIKVAINAAQKGGKLPAVEEQPNYTVEIPSDSTNGDFSTNIALVGAKAYKLPPIKIAQAIEESLELSDSFVSHTMIAGPGFLNFFLKPDWRNHVLLTIARLKENYGHTDFGKGKKVVVEFVSANPTGPMHLGNARGGALGDCLASAMDASGFKVSREFYINDAGNQIEKFAKSLSHRYMELYLGDKTGPFPEDGYHGDDIIERAKEYAQINGDKLVSLDEQARGEALVDYALPKNIQKLRDDLEKYKIEYDVWFSESSLHQNNLVSEALDKLTQRGLTYEKDGAVWYKASEFGGEKDEVLIRQNGNSTYFAADIAYHYDKLAVRDFDLAIDVWGADHHGHVARLKGSLDAIGLSGDRLQIVLMQMVRLIKDGEPYRMSKRSGKSVTLVDLLEEVPIDAARFFFNMSSPGAAIDFDLDLAAKQSSDNPVYYVQYAHARICSIIAKMLEEGVSVDDYKEEELSLLVAPEEIALIKLLAGYPSELVLSSTRFDPSNLTHYATNLAMAFHKFYTACRVKGEERCLTQARLCLCNCTRITLKNLLSLLKISAPDVM